ncbi:MAG TPA: biotin--[acetyl-CoA-carboxylase] ligase [bacterium]|nr:biotin--[acetyl-CoA-carboxylase] ligase [bacterium]
MNHFHHLERIGSTQETALAAGREGAPSGSLWLADSQSAGKGRLGRHWESKPGLGLYFSLLLRPAMRAAMAPLTTLAVGLGLAEALRGQGLKDLIVKWPNDLLVGGRKLGGILTEMVHRGEFVDFLVIGVGINVTHGQADFSPELQGSATSLRQVQDRNWDRLQLLEILQAAIAAAVDRLLDQGPADLCRRWEEQSGMVGRTVAYAGDKGLAREGRVLGLDPEGRLRVRHADGSVAELIAEDTTLL